jgi:hypothetical protein
MPRHWPREILRAIYEEGGLDALQERTGFSFGHCQRLARGWGAIFDGHKRAKPITERDLAIYHALRAGTKGPVLAREHKLSVSAIYGIVYRVGVRLGHTPPPGRMDIGKTEEEQAAIERRKAECEAGLQRLRMGAQVSLTRGIYSTYRPWSDPGGFDNRAYGGRDENVPPRGRG